MRRRKWAYLKRRRSEEGERRQGGYNKGGGLLCKLNFLKFVLRCES